MARGRSITLLLVLVGLFAAGACSDRANLPWGGGDDSASDDDDGDDDDVIATPTPWDFGDAHDGDRTITSASATLNTCHAITTASGTQLTAPTATGFIAGRRLLVWQVHDDLSFTSGAGADVTSIGRSGLFELPRITAVDTGVSPVVVTLDRSLANAYDSNGGARAQACTVPEFRDLTISGPTGQVEANQWTGSRNGVVAVLVDGTLTVGGAGLNAVGFGLRGGKRAPAYTGSDQTALDFAVTDGRGGGKGEGFDVDSYLLAGRGGMGNAGGGGNAQLGGGGGGGAAGRAGAGGYAANGSNGSTRGHGGAPIVADAASLRLLFGAGGGAGQSSTGAGGVYGSNGGGIVVVIARTLAGGGTISARGSDGADTLSNGGGGGGGGGGTVLLITGDPSSFTGVVVVRGGIGGDSSNLVEMGPGGGGGGGWFLSTDTAGSFTVNGNGGAAGVNDLGATRGADAGGPGIVRKLEIELLR